MSSLNIGIHAEIQMGSLLGGRINWPLGCNLAISQGYYLIQADLMQRGSAGLDVLGLLNEAFHSSLPTGYIIVDEAGFFTFGHLQEAQQEKALPDIFPASTLPKELASTILPMDNTTGFWLVLDLEAIDILDHLLEIGVQGQPNRLALYGQLDSTTNNMQESLHKLTLCANLPTISLLGLFTFKDLSFRLSIASENRKSFQLDGDIQVNIFGNSYLFHGSLDADNRSLAASITSDYSLDTLFGGQMHGVAFGGLSFMLAHTFKDAENSLASAKETSLPPCKPGETLIWLTGNVAFAELELTGELYLTESLPVFARLRLTRDLSISDFVSQAIPGCGWPSDLFDLQFMEGSQIYYREPQAALPSVLSGEDYQDGFNVLAHICLTVLGKLEFSLGVQVLQDGMKASVSLESSLDLFIIQLTGPGGNHGPSFALDTTKGQSKLQFWGGVHFFNYYCGDVAISCAKNTKGDLKVEGAISVADNVFRALIPHGSNLGFSYDSDAGFSLTGWSEFDFAHDCIDFISEIKKWTQTGRSDVCSMISGFINEKLLKTNFSLSPSFASEKDRADDSDRLYMCLDGQYTLSMCGTVILTLDFPATVKFLMPESLSWRELPDAIAKALAGAVPSLFEGIANNSENLAKLLFALSGEKAVEVAATLLCRNLIDKIIANAIRSAATALAEEYGGSIAPALAGGAAGAGGSVLAIITSQLLDHPSPKPKPDPDQSSPPDKPEDLVAQTWADDSGRRGILFSWSPAALAEKYRVSLHDDKETCLGQQETKDSVCEAFFPVSGDSSVHWYLLTVSAYGNNQNSESSSCKFIFEFTLDETVARAFTEGLDGAACGERVGSLFPQANPTELARSMAKAGYAAQETLPGLAAAKPGLGLDEMAAALVAVYGVSESLDNVVARSFADGLDGAVCGKRIDGLFPQAEPVELARSMAKAGYTAQEALAGLAAAWPNLGLDEMAAALVAVYGIAESLDNVVLRSFTEGLDGAACGKRVGGLFPQAGLTDLAKSMAKAGYAAQETLAGLAAARPNLGLDEMAAALVAAYGTS